jgi:ArsR family transcriptional regulator, arsenate/arsenite/antimonite-responsive transcriptional repressor
VAHKKTALRIERLFQGLADRTRLRLLNLIADREVCVCYFVEVLFLPQPTISRHLAYLRRIGLVRARRHGKWMHYRFVVPRNASARRLMADAFHWLATEPDMQQDLARLNRVCCAPEKFAKLQEAPPPIDVADWMNERTPLRSRPPGNL